MLKIHEIFNSISGEVCNFGQGRLCTFIRLQGCNMHCNFCDTPDTLNTNIGEHWPIEKILEKVKKYNSKNIIITGGEPLNQILVNELIRELINLNYKIHIETNGSIAPSNYLIESPQVNFIVDCKLDYTDKMIFPYEELGQNDFIKYMVVNKEHIYEAINHQIKISNCHIVPFFAPKFAYSIIQSKYTTVNYNDLLSCLQTNKLDAFINYQVHKALKLK